MVLRMTMALGMTMTEHLNYEILRFAQDDNGTQDDNGARNDHVGVVSSFILSTND